MDIPFLAKQLAFLLFAQKQRHFLHLRAKGMHLPCTNCMLDGGSRKEPSISSRLLKLSNNHLGSGPCRQISRQCEHGELGESEYVSELKAGTLSISSTAAIAARETCSSLPKSSADHLYFHCRSHQGYLHGDIVHQCSPPRCGARDLAIVQVC